MLAVFVFLLRGEGIMINFLKDTWWILLIGFAVLVAMVFLCIIIHRHHKDIRNDCFDKPKDPKAENSERGSYKWKKDIDEDEMRKHYDTFNKHCAWYNVCTQAIPLFPLMGVLGTVLGLVGQVNAGTNAEEIFGSLGLALNTTITGIVVSLILKGVDLLFLSYIIVRTDGIFTNYYKKMEIDNKK